MTKKEMIAEVNAKIERVNELLQEISGLGWDIHSYLQKKYKAEGFEYDEDVIKDPHDKWIAKQARYCGSIILWNEFGFGDNRLALDGKKHDARYYEPMYRRIGYYNDWEDIQHFLNESMSSAACAYKKGDCHFYTVDDDTVYRPSDFKGKNSYRCDGGKLMEVWDIPEEILDTFWDGTAQPCDNCYIDIYERITNY